MGDHVFGAFGKPFTPAGQIHYGFTQDLCANTVQWWKQPALAGNGYSPEYNGSSVEESRAY